VPSGRGKPGFAGNSLGRRQDGGYPGVVSNKSGRIAAMIAGLQGRSRDAHYLGYFECFNQGLYYEAHDVLEELWLAGGKTAPNYSFHKGLIQFAGAFVHLQKGRLGPAVALFNLADANLAKYPTDHEGMSVDVVRVQIDAWRQAAREAEPAGNPLGNRPPPRIDLRRL
jgi:hypothetical protein